MHVEVVERPRCLTHVYGPNSSAVYLKFVEESNDAMRRVKLTYRLSFWKTSILMLGTTNCIMNTFFQHRDILKYTWCRGSLGHWPLIGFHKVPADLFRSLDVRVKRCAELSTDQIKL